MENEEDLTEALKGMSVIALQHLKYYPVEWRDVLIVLKILTSIEKHITGERPGGSFVTGMVDGNWAFAIEKADAINTRYLKIYKHFIDNFDYLKRQNEKGN